MTTTMAPDQRTGGARKVFSRYVAIGDSTTEGLEDPYPDGRGYRGWADRLAERLAAVNPDLLYANLAVRGKLSGQIRADQLEPALAMEPDVVTVVGGLNDMLRRGCDVGAVTANVTAMFEAFTATGARVLTFTYPDPVLLNPLTRSVRGRLREFNDALRDLAADHDAVLVDFGRESGSSDPRFWHRDRLHGNTAGHERVAAAFAHALGLPGADDSWATPLPPPPPAARHQVVAGEVAWAIRHAAPWIARRLRGRSSGDGRVAKRPELTPVAVPSGG